MSENNKIHMNSREEEDLSEETNSFISSLPYCIKPKCKKLYMYQKCWYSQKMIKGVINFQRNFKPQDTDIIDASFPKCGTTWLKALAFALTDRTKHIPNDEHHPLVLQNPHTLVPYLELNLYFNSQTPYLTSFTSFRRTFSTHTPLHTLQEPIKDCSCKIVYVCRNVKDAMVSYWQFFHIKMNNCDFDEMFESFCKGVTFFGPFWDHILSYWKESLVNPKNVLFMKYEELKDDPHGQIKKLAKFLDCPFTKEEEQNGIVDQILDLCSLQNLSSLEINKTGKLKDGTNCNRFFRKGEIGDSKNYLNLEMENKIDMIMKEKFENSDFEF